MRRALAEGLVAAAPGIAFLLGFAVGWLLIGIGMTIEKLRRR